MLLVLSVKFLNQIGMTFTALLSVDTLLSLCEIFRIKKGHMYPCFRYCEDNCGDMSMCHRTQSTYALVRTQTHTLSINHGLQLNSCSPATSCPQKQCTVALGHILGLPGLNSVETDNVSI